MRSARVLIVIVAVALLAALPAWPAAAGQPKTAAAEQSADRWRRRSSVQRPTPTVSRPSSSPAGFLRRSGTELTIDGTPRKLLGVNAYSLATDWSFNPGCGKAVDVEAFFASLPPGALVRFWAFQSLTSDVSSGRQNFAAVDRVVRAAERYGQKLVVVLGSHWGTCDGGRNRDLAWYDGGYSRTYGDARTAPRPYIDHMRAMVSRYRASPAVGIWELLNEPEVPCAAAPVLRRFLDVVGGELKRLDPGHLLGSGVIGTGQCGSSGDDYSKLHASPAVDVASYHDYDDARPIPGDRWNGMAVRMAQARSLNKPLIVGEAGLQAGAGGCMTPAARRDAVKAKVDAQFRGGVQALVVWAQIFGGRTGCSYEFEADDPVLDLVRS